MDSHLCHYLENSAARFPDRVAVVDSDGSALTYSELNERASCVAGFLTGCGISRGDRVGLMLPKSGVTVTALFGILKAGAAYVPVDWAGPAERVRSILTNCEVRAIFVDPSRVDVAADIATVIVPGPETASGSGIFSWETCLEHVPPKDGVPARSADDLAYILYTSGSTGIPKGVSLTHRNATSFVDWCSSVFEPSETDRFSSHAPFYFDLSILDIYVPLKHGASLHLIAEDVGKNPKDLARFIAARQLTVWYSTPAILSLLGEFGDLDKLDYSALRLVLFAGEVFPVKQLRRLVAALPHPQYFNLYGPTETNVCTFAHIPTPIPDDRSEPYPIGWPCSHCEALLLDSGQLPVEAGDEGLLYIAGSAVFSGYWGQENGDFFLERDGRCWYNTGDVVKPDAVDGFLYIGRRDRMVKRRGYRIELGEVESCLYRHPGVSSAAVVAVPHPEAGTRIVACLVAREEERPSMIELKVFCNRHLPPYMNPDVFVFFDSLPMTPTNKINYQELIRRAQPAATPSLSSTRP